MSYPPGDVNVVLNGFTLSDMGNFWGDAELLPDWGDMLRFLKKDRFSDYDYDDYLPDALVDKWYEPQEIWDTLA